MTKEKGPRVVSVYELTEKAQKIQDILEKTEEITQMVKEPDKKSKKRLI